MNKEQRKEYARLIAQVGANVQPGQEVILYAGLDQPEFVTEVPAACYDAGAKKVRVEWSYDPLQVLQAQRQDQTVLETVEDWEKGARACPAYVAELIAYRVQRDPTFGNGQSIDQMIKAK